MKININLNELKYRIDVYNMFNIYFPLDEFKFVDEILNCDYLIKVSKDEVIFKKDNFILKRKNNGDIKNTLKKCIFESLKELTKENHPWGILVGIRPSKIALKLINEGKTDEEIIKIFKEKYLTEEEKTKLCIEVAKSEQLFVNREQGKISIYIGMAFCPTRCVYCSFSSNPIGSNKNLVKPYLEALKKEIDSIKRYIEEKNLQIETVYFGGGTPTAVSDLEFKDIMYSIFKAFIKDKNIKEFTVECGRPDSISKDKLLTMKNYSVNRISINPQTMNNKTLSLIGRGHTEEETVNVFKLARKIGFEDINMDIIIGLPGEGLKEVKRTVEKIKELKPDSLTVHGLSLKRGSTLYEKFLLKKGLGIKAQDEILKMFEESTKLSKDLEVYPYYMYRQKNMVGNMENLGYAKKGKECIYNIQMIEERQTIIALGADGVSKIINLNSKRIERYPNVKDVKEYIKRIDKMIEGKINILNTIYNN